MAGSRTAWAIETLSEKDNGNEEEEEEEEMMATVAGHHVNSNCAFPLLPYAEHSALT